MCTKICKQCNVGKNCVDFHKMKGGLFGIRNVCKECRKKEKEEYQLRDYVIERTKKYYQENKIVIRERTNKHRWTLNGQFHQYKKSAKKRGITWNLTQEECTQFYKTNCYYCNDIIRGLGIDRTNNEIGYEIDNVVPCCSTCNFMKYTLNLKTFLDHIQKIIANINKNNE